MTVTLSSIRILKGCRHGPHIYEALILLMLKVNNDPRRRSNRFSSYSSYLWKTLHHLIVTCTSLLFL